MPNFENDGTQNKNIFASQKEHLYGAMEQYTNDKALKDFKSVPYQKLCGKRVEIHEQCAES